MGKVENKKRQKKDALLNTAFDLFVTKGIQKTSISDIVEKAGVAKGTFYLYFSDKYDLRNKLIAHKANQLFNSAYASMQEAGILDFEERMIFICDYVIEHLSQNKSLLSLVNKHLSWGIFKNTMSRPSSGHENNVADIYEKLLSQSEHAFRNPEIMIFMIVEMVGATIYSPILYQLPVGLEEMKPYIFENIRSIIRSHTVGAGSPSCTHKEDGKEDTQRRM